MQDIRQILVLPIIFLSQRVEKAIRETAILDTVLTTKAEPDGDAYLAGISRVSEHFVSGPVIA